jgi:DNA polymerase III epsilon subunit-like protein
MRYPLSTPAELADAPELAPLVILGSAAEVSRRALLAAHPELLDRDFIDEEPEISARQCIAASILASLEVLAEAIRHYQAHLDNLAARRPIGRRDDEDDIPF